MQDTGYPTDGKYRPDGYVIRFVALEHVIPRVYSSEQEVCPGRYGKREFEVQLR